MHACLVEKISVMVPCEWLICAVVLYHLTKKNTIVGGTFALYSLISRYAKVSLIPNQQAEDAMVSSYCLDTVSAPMRRAQRMKKSLENSKVAKVAIYLLTILGTSMVISDGALTPAISGN